MGAPFRSGSVKRGAARILLLALTTWLGLAPTSVKAQDGEPAFFRYVRDPQAALIAFNPSGYDPRRPATAAEIPSADVRADLAALRPAFDGLVLYATHEGLTERIVEAAVDQGFRALLLGVWDPRSEAEIAAAADLIRRHCRQIACALVIGNEGINDNRYTLDDVRRAAARVRARLPEDVILPITTSEPSGDYGWRPLRDFGDFLAPNIHPAIDQAARDPEAAADWVHGRARAIAFVSRKPVVVKETGMPNGGTPPFTPDRQLAFWSHYLAGGRLRTVGGNGDGAWTFHGVAFEAFDAPWKAELLRDPIEGRWGLFTTGRAPYPAARAWRR